MRRALLWLALLAVSGCTITRTPNPDTGQAIIVVCVFAQCHWRLPPAPVDAPPTDREDGGT